MSRRGMGSEWGSVGGGEWSRSWHQPYPEGNVWLCLVPHCLPGGNGNMMLKMKGFGGGIVRIQNRFGIGMISGYARMNKMAVGVPGGMQLSSYSMRFSANGNVYGLGSKIESGGLGTTFGISVGNLGAVISMKQGTGIGHPSSANQRLGRMVSYGYSFTGIGGQWRINDDGHDNVYHSDDSDDL
ncbi:hypothetical protein CHS0354_036411 [Potamilus streckersoni]|uniref:Uncharacterized protein n=1 Tax=Potamilus streckersoni TaxID=2493646 RepID=A0AAE0SWT8_9BIVA|nr:hypothetical protein CHS0354_036411 [Potamilus streckersoni]